MAAVPPAVEPMLAQAGPLPDDARYHYEFKWDGYRACLRVGPTGAIRLNSRNGNDLTAEYPELAGGLGDMLGGRAAVFDGEIVALDEGGVPDFTLLQNRRTRRHALSFFAFDLLRLGAEALENRTYRERRDLLTALEPGNPNLFAIPPAYSHADLSATGLTPDGLLDVARQSRLEGLVAKASESRYHPGRRSPEWIKHALITTQEVVIGGWRPGGGRRTGTLGALLLGAHDDRGDLRYIGDVGTGFTQQALDDLHTRLGELGRNTSPFADQVPRDRAKNAHWVEPRLVGEVVYRRFTSDGRLRHTAWRGLRPDRDPAEAKLESLR
ncbi:non-homologous end-joining DNA ligase [Amycolatopsis sp. 195334CR]|uniref:non-homologous end-joining DNA ligase n=1 Tax=Amycolatopsis sp. 195334CR TaxID=2814588 RepID=UPI001A8DB125|nr:non-homologous end-joining DNA ligase [Amycolatopsis sp. 195334CR]MBN6036882.1 non-homologous end-joining DNA ligase [Amycolatopsis sp. 195334CR]